MANTTIKISQLANIGGNLNANALIPIVSNTGTLITDKILVGNLANFVLSEAGNLLVEAFVSDIAYSVSNASQPNITSLGNLTSLTISNLSNLHIPGGTNGYVLQTNGSGNLNWTAMSGSGNGNPGGANSQIQFNNNGLFGGDTSLTWDASNAQLNTVSIAASSATIYGNTALTNLNVSANLTTNNIFTDNYFYANGDPFTGNGGGNIGNLTINDTTISTSQNKNILIASNANSNVFMGSNNYVSLIWQPNVSNISFDSNEGMFIWVESNGAYIWTHNFANNANYQWQFDTNGGILTPNTNNTQVHINGSVVTINGDPCPANNVSQTLTEVYVASNSDVIAVDMSLRVQSTEYVEIVNLNIAKEITNANLCYSINSQLKTNDLIDNTIIVVGLNVDDKIVVSANCQTASNVFYTYEIKEYRITD